MPNRILRDWTDSEAVNSISIHAERLFVRLIMKVDDFGRFSGNPTLLKASLFPLLLGSIREADVSRWIAECEKAGLLRSYAVSGKRYLEIQKFQQRTRQDHSKFPNPPPSNDGQLTVNGRSIDGLDGDVFGDGDEGALCVEPSSPPPDSDFVLLRFPVKGKTTIWDFRSSVQTELKAAFPDLNVLAQAKKALAWCQANPAKQKTESGMKRFLFSWMDRAQNNGDAKKPVVSGGSRVFVEDR